MSTTETTITTEKVTTKESKRIQTTTTIKSTTEKTTNTHTTENETVTLNIKLENKPIKTETTTQPSTVNPALVTYYQVNTKIYHYKENCSKLQGENVGTVFLASPGIKDYKPCEECVNNE